MLQHVHPKKKKNRTFSYITAISLLYPTHLAIILSIHLIPGPFSKFPSCPTNVYFVKTEYNQGSGI